MNTKFAALLVSASVAVVLFVSAADAKCVTRHGKGWAWTEDMAKFQAWEIVSQLHGNWPLPETSFRKERYSCKKDGSGYTCLSTIEVCK
jgi:hypothetical protein